MTCGLRLKRQQSSGGNDRAGRSNTDRTRSGLRGEERGGSVWMGCAKRIGVALCGHRQARWIVARAWCCVGVGMGMHSHVTSLKSLLLDRHG
jgi:hypothetical protein